VAQPSTESGADIRWLQEWLQEWVLTHKVRHTLLGKAAGGRRVTGVQGPLRHMVAELAAVA
jgi:hypothetical protein